MDRLHVGVGMMYTGFLLFAIEGIVTSNRLRKWKEDREKQEDATNFQKFTDRNNRIYRQAWILLAVALITVAIGIVLVLTNK
jgi:predicted RND superfamily exporter protein